MNAALIKEVIYFFIFQCKKVITFKTNCIIKCYILSLYFYFKCRPT